MDGEQVVHAGAPKFLDFGLNDFSSTREVSSSGVVVRTARLLRTAQVPLVSDFNVDLLHVSNMPGSIKVPPDQYSLNSERHGHALAALLRTRRAIESGTALYSVAEAIQALAESTCTGRFGSADRHLRAAMAQLPEPLAGSLLAIERQVANSSSPIEHHGNPGEAGAQALAGLICARLLRNPTHPLSPAPTLPASLRDSAGTRLADALVERLITCRSKEQIGKSLDDFVAMFSRGDVALPPGRLSVLDEARRAKDRCDTFNVEEAGMRLQRPRALIVLGNFGVARCIEGPAVRRPGHGLTSSARFGPPAVARAASANVDPLVLPKLDTRYGI